MADQEQEQQRRPQSALAYSPGMSADFHSATDAMQRAAEAMIAATETFRRQFQSHEDLPQRPITYHNYRTPEGGYSSQSSAPASRDGRPSSLQVPPSLSGSTAPVTMSSSRPGTGNSAPAMLPVFAPQRQHTPVPAHSSLAEFLPQIPHPARMSTDSGKFGARVSPTNEPRESCEAIVSMTPTADWPTISGSVPNLASTLAPPAVKTGPGSVWRRQPAHVDLVEAASRLARPTSLPPGPGGYPSYGVEVRETESPVQMGRYRYVRTDGDEFQTSLIHEKDSQRVPPPGGGASSERPHGFSLFQEIMFVLMISLAQMLMLAGIAQGLVPGAIIGQTFPDTSLGSIAWYSASYGLTAGTFVLPAGRLGDLFGHKKIFIIGFLWFGLWSLIAGFAELVQQAGGRGTVFFIFSRAMQGIGPALLVPNGQAMLGRAYKPGPRKNMVMCLFSAAAPFGFVVGGAMASLFAVKASWPWAFWTLAAMCTALAAISVAVIPPTEQTRKTDKESLWVQLDAPGMLLGVSGLVLFNFAFNQAPIVSWGTPYTYFLLIIGLMLLAAFAYTERVAPHPLVPLTAMRSTANFVLGCTAAGWGCFAVWVFYSFAFLERLRGWTPLMASAGMAHGPLSGLAASILTGFLMSRKVKPQWIMLISMCAFFVGSLLLATAPIDQSYWFNTFFSILVMPFGMDMSNPAATILLSNSVSREHQGIAASLVVTTVNYSISLALGIAGTLETSFNNGGVDNPGDILAGYHSAEYFGLGLGLLGVTLATAFLIQSYVRKPNLAPGPG